MKKLLSLLMLLCMLCTGAWATHIGPFKFTNWDKTGTWTAVSNYKINYPYYTSQENVEFTSDGDLTVSFQFQSGNTRFECLGVDLVNAQGEVVKSDYRHQFTGGGKPIKTYTLTGVEAGTYTIRYWSCKFGDDGRDNSTGLNTGSGTITTTYTGGHSNFTITGWTNRVVGWTACRDNVPNALCKVIHDTNFGSSSNLHWHTDSNLKFYEAGDFNLQFLYADGSWRLDTRGVELLNENGDVVAANYHEGYSGNQQDHRDYNISVPEAGTYSLRIIVQSSDITSTNNSWGTIVYSCTSNPYHYEQYICDMITEHPDMIGWPVPTEEIKAFSTTNRINESNVADFRTKLSAITNINRPQDGHVYRFANYSNYKSGLKRYMTYQNGQALGLKINPSEAANFYCRKVGDNKYIFYTNDGNILTWLGTTSGDMGFKQNGTNGWGYSEAYPATQDNKTDWNEISFQKQANSIDQVGMVKLIGRRTSSSTSVFVPNGTNENWDRADNSSFFQTSDSYHTTAFYVEEVTDGAVLGHAKGEAKYVIAKHNNLIGTELNQYQFTDKDNNKTPNVYEAIAACSTFDQANNVVHSIAINLPQTGKFYRLKATNNRFMCSDPENGGANDPQVYSLREKAGNEKSTIFHLTDDHHLIAYATGTSVSWGWKTTLIGADHDCTWTISEAENAVGKYAIQCPTTTTWADLVYIGYNNNTHVTREGSQNVYTAWEIEEVTSLPLTVGETTFATFYTPVNVAVPSGITPYVCHLNGENLAMYTCKQKTTIGSNEYTVIPAHTAVMIKSNNAQTYSLSVVEDESIEEYTNNSFFGDVATKPFAEDYTYYSLQRDNTANDGTVGFFVKPSGNFKGFQAFLKTEKTQQVNRFNVTFDEDSIVTGIADVLNATNTTIPAFDLAGRKVDAYNQRGLYINKGKKIIR